MKRHLFILFALCFALLSCNNDDDNASQNPMDQLPPATQTGENTMGYLVNGNAVSVTHSNLITAVYQGNLLQIGGGVNNNDLDIDLDIVLENPLEINTTYLLTNFPIHRARYRDFEILNECDYDYQDTYVGSIMFTKIDTTNYIVSGIFQFETAVDNCETIKITNGRFDLQYIP